MPIVSSAKAFFDSPKFNFWGAVVSALAEITSWFSIFGGSDSVLSAQGGRIAFALTVFFLGRLAWIQYWQAESYRERQKPRFDIVFLPENEDDSRPYIQTLEFGQFKGSGFPMVKMSDRRYRVGVVNLSTATVPNVRVILESCTPSDNFIHIGHRLLVMDSNPPIGERDLPPSVDGHPTLWFDVVNELMEGDTRPAHFQFCFANPNICGPVMANDYEIVLRAEGGNVSRSRSFRVVKLRVGRGWQTKLTMMPV